MNPRALYYLLRYGLILLREIVLATIAVTKLVFGPLDRLRSGFVALEMDARTDLEITAFANSITLTPGTITVHVDPRKRLLVMHAIDTGDDLEALRQATKATLERNVLLWTHARRKESRR